ncbi:MAG TPA: maltose alpha-D-glucosyltransferase [Gemmataceae bacterium]|jgi:maltose alpha-D-glucosyltransferase/alpha-amylase|nr:maltose alpha-D-glucosyltransferase [Gemmataceae bacterium]
MTDTHADWYRDAIFYQVSVRGFHDSNADGVGDLRGLIQKLDYIRDLGVDCLWLMPLYPSPLKDDGYDIADFCAIHPSLGTVDDFEALTKAAHERGIRVIADLVLNHTSDLHPWFQESRRNPDSPYRDYYVWSDNDQKYQGVRIIFKDTEQSNWAWDSVARRYFWHRFFSHQPDLNYDNPAVQEEILKVVAFWLDRGIDGFRVDAVPYLFEREGTTCENLPETHQFLKKIRRFVDEKYPGTLLLAEANMWPEDLLPYFGGGDEFHMAFNFPLMPRMFMAIRREQSWPIIEIMDRLPSIPTGCQWATFLRNHDELTLEMVTDEERDYMYREYANDPRMRINLGIRRRLAPLVDGDRAQAELLHSLLFTLPGSPVLYYGDEIGMGDNVYLGDRNGVRTPMQWNGDRNAGFSRADPSQLYAAVIQDPLYHYQARNVEASLRTSKSFLMWLRRVIRMRKSYPAFGRGTLRFVTCENRRVIAYLREYDGQTLLVVNNLSAFAQPAELDLRPFAGAVPVELLGNQEFPRLTDRLYFLSLGAHSFYWFRLDRPAEVAPAPDGVVTEGQGTTRPVPGGQMQ